MLIYLLTRTDELHYDENNAAVVAAIAPEVARSVAATDLRGDEPAETWISPRRSKCERIGHYSGPRIRPHVVLASFNNG